MQGNNGEFIAPPQNQQPQEKKKMSTGTKFALGCGIPVGFIFLTIVIVIINSVTYTPDPEEYISTAEHNSVIEALTDANLSEIAEMEAMLEALQDELDSSVSENDKWATAMANELAAIVYDMERENWTAAQWDAYEAGEAQTDEIVGWMAGGILQFFGLADDKEEAQEVIDMFGGIQTDTQRGEDFRTQERLQEWMAKYITQYNGNKSLAKGSTAPAADTDEEYSVAREAGRKAGQITADFIDDWYNAGSGTEDEE